MADSRHFSCSKVDQFSCKRSSNHSQLLGLVRLHLVVLLLSLTPVAYGHTAQLQRAAIAGAATLAADVPGGEEAVAASTKTAAGSAPSLPALSVRERCTANSYAELYNLTRNLTACGGDDQYFFLNCTGGRRMYQRGRLPALMIQHDSLETQQHEPSVHILPSGDCEVVIYIDLTLSPQLPALTVHGDLGIHKFALHNVSFLVKGNPADAMPDWCNLRPCRAPPIIQLHDVEHIDLLNVTIRSEGSVPLPYSGLYMKTIASGVPRIFLQGVVVTHMLDAITIIGGGNLSAINTKGIYSPNAGLYYACSMIQQSAVYITGASSFSSNAVGIFVDCAGDFDPLEVIVQGQVAIARNTKHGMVLFGHNHATLGPGVRFYDNGWGDPANRTLCGGSLHAHFQYGTPNLALRGVEFVNNTAQFGAGLCVEVPADAQPLFGKISGSVDFKGTTKFTSNVATTCGGALATVTDMTKSRMKIYTQGVQASAANNTAPWGPSWCVMADYNDSTTWMEVYLP